MSIVKPDRSPPQDIIENIRKTELIAISEYNLRNFERSIQMYNEILELMYQTQIKINRPIHKGAPLHMIGINYNGMNNHSEAIRYILLAYVEDTLNADYENEDEADNSPAGQMMMNYYGVNVKLLNDIKLAVREKKRQGEWAEIIRPELIFEKIKLRIKQGIISSGESPRIQIQPMVQTPTQHPFGFPQPWEDRVFVGGSYHTHMHVLRYIEQLIRALNFTPIIAFDVDINPERTHHHTLLLLHTCKYAIFDVSNPAGQLMEIERTIDYQNEVLLLHSTLSEGGGPSPYVSSMLRTMKIRMEGYSNLEDIAPIIRDFLT